MMKNMYNEGDDQMKKMIGEAMTKATRGGAQGGGDLPGMGDLSG